MELVITVFLLALGVNCVEEDFYWKNFNRQISRDAIPTGRDAQGVTYVGQAQCDTYGILAGTIREGNEFVYINCGGSKLMPIVHVLAAHNLDNFYWIETSNATLERDVLNKRIVRSGLHYIGRVIIDAEVIIGIIGGNYFNLYFTLNGTEQTTTQYQILINGIV